jgi:hypothetical protein
MALGVLSHWFADLIAHTPDLPIINGEPKLGLGLWHNKLLTFVTEAALLIISLFYYLKNTKAIAPIGQYAAIGLTGFLILAAFLNFYVLPQETNIGTLAASALLAYFAFAGLAAWVDGKRI